MALSAGISALLDSSIRAGLKAGFSGRRILAGFREAGGRIRDAVFFQHVRQISQELEQILRFRALRDHVQLNERNLRAVFQKGISPFAVIFEVAFTNEATGLQQSKFITLNFSTPETIAELKRRAIFLEDSNITESDQRNPFQGAIESIVLVDGLRRLEPAIL